MRILVAIGLVAAALALPAVAWGYGTEVNPYACSLSGGHVFRPAGTEIVVRQGWAATQRSYSWQFISAQQTIISVNGSTPYNLSRDWTTPRLVSPENWVTWVFFPTLVTLAPGESLSFHFVTSLRRTVYDGVSYGGPGEIIDSDCTVTGV
jgi:hypothetical protein